MVPYHQVSQTQKDNFFGLIRGIFDLYAPEEQSHYRISQDHLGICVKERTLNSPPNDLKEKIETIVSNLNDMRLLEYRRTNVSIRLGLNMFPVPSIVIERVNTELMDQLLDSSPEEVPIQIPENIQRYMNEFSPELQEYIKQCLRENLREAFERNPSTMILMSIAPSPIGLTRHLQIPVRLPNAVLGVSNEHYDLVELSILPTNADGSRNDPLNRQPFRLDQIIPAPEILQQIKDRMLGARDRSPMTLS